MGKKMEVIRVHELSPRPLENAYIRLLESIYCYGDLIGDERGSLTKDLANVHVQIDNPLATGFLLNGRFLPEILPKIPSNIWFGKKLHSYCRQFLNSDGQGFIYTYGERLNQDNQLRNIINRLKSNLNSRRALITTWRHQIDSINNEVPCMILVDFKFRQSFMSDKAKKLNVTALWRSHDIFGAYYPNIVGLTYLSQYVASTIGVELGSITIHSNSAHIYETDWEDTKKLLKVYS
jgi:thymidylate synthase